MKPFDKQHPDYVGWNTKIALKLGADHRLNDDGSIRDVSFGLINTAPADLKYHDDWNRQIVAWSNFAHQVRDHVAQSKFTREDEEFLLWKRLEKDHENAIFTNSVLDGFVVICKLIVFIERFIENVKTN